MKHVEISYGHGSTSRYLELVNGEFHLLDYEIEEDAAHIHEMCGGRQYYTSRSGSSGAGWVKSYGDLVPVGLYRVDTVEPWLEFKPIVGDWEIALPYVSHEGDRAPKTLAAYPTVLKNPSGKIIFLSFRHLKTVLEQLVGDKIAYKRVAEKVVGQYGQYKEVVIEYNDGYLEDEARGKVSPWVFFRELLSSSAVGSSLPWSIARVAWHDVAKQYVKTRWVGGLKIGYEFVGADDPCENMVEAPAGWQLLDTNCVYKANNIGQVYAVGWALAQPLYQEKVQLAATLLPAENQEDFLSYAKRREMSKFFLGEIPQVEKSLFLLKKEEYLAEINHQITQAAINGAAQALEAYLVDGRLKKLSDAVPNNDETVVGYTDDRKWQIFSCPVEWATIAVSGRELKELANDPDRWLVRSYLWELGERLSGLSQTVENWVELADKIRQLDQPTEEPVEPTEELTEEPTEAEAVEEAVEAAEDD